MILLCVIYFGQYKSYPSYLKDQLLRGKMLVGVVEVVALAHGVHFLHLLTTVLPPVLLPVSCGSYPGLSGSPVIPKPLSRDPSQGKNKCCFWNFLLKDDQPCRQVRLVHLVLVQVCLVHRHNLPVLRLWSVFTNTFAPQVEMEMRWKYFSWEFENYDLLLTAWHVLSGRW